MDSLPTSGSEKLVVLKMSGSKLRLPLLLRRAGDALLLEDCGFRGSAEPRRKVYSGIHYKPNRVIQYSFMFCN